jgi:hypothetical protein
MPLSFRQLEEIMAERNLGGDHVTICRCVQRYAPELNRRCRPELRNTMGRGAAMRPASGSPANGPIPEVINVDGTFIGRLFGLTAA